MPPPSSIVAPGIAKLFDVTLGADGFFDTGPNFLPPGYSSLLLIATLRSSGSGVSGPGIRFNGDTGNNYDRAYFRNDGSVSATGRSSIDSLVAVGTSADANTYGQNEFWIPNYSDTTTRKITTGMVWAYQAGGTGSMFIGTAGGRWNVTTAINQIAITDSSNLKSGSRLIIYGMP